MEINKLGSANDRATNLQDAESKLGAKPSGSISQDASQTSATDGPDRTDAPSTVQISAAAQVLAEAKDALSKVSDVDLDRVQEIRSAIEQGTYHVDPQRLAANFLDLENQLFS